MHGPSAGSLPVRSPETLLQRVLEEASDAWTGLVLGLHFPPPLPDEGEGGDARFDLYVAEGAGSHVQVVPGHLDLLSDHDAAQAFVVVPSSLALEGGCRLRQELGFAIAHASLLGLDAAETPSVVEGLARHAGHRLAPCPSLDEPRMRELQADPSRPLSTTLGAELLAKVLDERWGQGFVRVVPALTSMAAQHRATGALGRHLHDRPTVFDALSATLRDRGSDLGDLFLEVARARLLDLPVEPAWDFRIRASVLPQRLAVRRGLAPGGSSLIRIDIDRPLAAIEADLVWEAEARFRWTLVRLDARGQSLGEVEVAKLEKVRSVSTEIRHLEPAAAVVLLAVHAPDRLDPHDEEPTAHGFEVSFFGR